MPLFNSASINSVYDTIYKVDQHGFARSIAYYGGDKTIFMAIDQPRAEGELVSPQVDNLQS